MKHILLALMLTITASVASAGQMLINQVGTFNSDIWIEAPQGTTVERKLFSGEMLDISNTRYIQLQKGDTIRISSHSAFTVYTKPFLVGYNQTVWRIDPSTNKTLNIWGHWMSQANYQEL